jgi:hypothetical protein
MPVWRFYIRGLLIGALVMTGFGAFWAVGGAFSLPNPAGALILFASPLVVAGLLVASFRLWRKAEILPAHSSPDESTYWRNSGKWFGLIFASEAALIAIASIVLGNTGDDALIPPVIALIVGLHFLLLAPLFRLPLYNITGLAISALALVCIVAVIAGRRAFGRRPSRSCCMGIVYCWRAQEIRPVSSRRWAAIW